MFNQNTNPNLISKLLPLKTNIDIPIMISYVTKLQCLKFGLSIVISNLQTFVRLDLSNKSFKSLATVVEIEVKLFGQIWEHWAWEVKG